MRLIKSYKNGNYNVSLFEDGTKIRETDEDLFRPDFPENIDMKISDRCDMGCPMCHEDSSIDGKNAHFNHKFLDTLRNGGEIAIGGGNIFENPDLINFLEFCKRKGLIANITINQSHAVGKYYSELKHLILNKLVYGVGISYNNNFKELNSFFDKMKSDNINTKNIVIHTINGIQNYSDIMRIADRNRKILILGYKDVRKGIEYKKKMSETISVNQQSIYDNIEIINKSFKVVSFDNLAIEQLEISRLLTKEEWEEFFMGNESEFTMYIDLVKEEFSLNSCAINYRHDLLDNIDDMFDIVKKDGLIYNKKEETNETN